MFHHGWLDCEHSNNFVDRVEHWFSWSTHMVSFLEFVFWHTGFRRDCGDGVPDVIDKMAVDNALDKIRDGTSILPDIHYDHSADDS
jgi:hypothetical protein